MLPTVNKFSGSDCIQALPTRSSRPPTSQDASRDGHCCNHSLPPTTSTQWTWTLTSLGAVYSPLQPQAFYGLSSPRLVFSSRLQLRLPTTPFHGIADVGNFSSASKCSLGLLGTPPDDLFPELSEEDMAFQTLIIDHSTSHMRRRCRGRPARLVGDRDV